MIEKLLEKLFYTIEHDEDDKDDKACIEFEVCPLKLKLICNSYRVFFPSIAIYRSSQIFPFDHCFIVWPHPYLSRLSFCEKLHFYHK